MIDRLREQIQHRLDQIVSEADRLRKALAALDPRSSLAPARKGPGRNAGARTRAGSPAPTRRATTRRPRPPAERPGAPVARRRTSQPTAEGGGAPSRRTAPGATRAAVLAALAEEEPMTAGEVAEKSGLARGVVSSTLSRLTRSGEVQKAARGYRLAQATAPPAPLAAPPAPLAPSAPAASEPSAVPATDSSETPPDATAKSTADPGTETPASAPVAAE